MACVFFANLHTIYFKVNIMRKNSIFHFIIVSAMSFLFLGNANAQNLQLTLDQALEIALSESNTVKLADKTVEKAGYAKKGSYATLYPNISANGSYQRTLKKQQMVMNFNGMEQTITMGQNNSVNAGVTASMPLIHAPLWESLKVSAMDVEMAVEQARSSKLSLVSQVKQAFYAALLAKESHQVMQEVYDNATKNYNETVNKYNVGKASEFEKMRAQVTMMNAEPNVTSAENAMVLTTWQLKALIGIDLDKDIEVVGNLSDYEGELLAGSGITPDFSYNSSLRQMEIQNRILDANTKMIKFQYIPTLAAQFSYNYVAMGDSLMKMNWSPYSTVAVSLSIPIFDGLSKHYNIKQMKVAKESLDMQREDMERNLNIAAKNYNDQMALCIKNYNAAKSAVEVAQKSYQISEKMYEVGKATLVELNDAQLAYTQSLLNMNQSIYNYMVAKAGLEELMGKE